MNPPTPAVAPPATDALRLEVLTGLRAEPKTLPTRLLYDAAGSRLFDRITALPEYYLTRTEQTILDRCLGEVARLVGSEALVVEPGSGNGAKARQLLLALDRPRAYVPLDVSEAHLISLVQDSPVEALGLEIHPVVADYTRSLQLPLDPTDFLRTLIFFPGSTIGNFSPAEAAAFLRRLGRLAGATGMILLGVDLRKSVDLLEPAYNDASGVTADFNLNVLRHLNRELRTNFEVSGFRHHAPWVSEKGRIEMRLLSRREQVVTIPDLGESEVDPVQVTIGSGEPIVTEFSQKYAPDELERLVAQAGWATMKEWQDGAGWYSVRLLERAH